MKMKKIFFISTVLLLSVSIDINAQQKPFFSQYNLNKFLLNPAVAGGSGLSSIGLTARQQFVGFENAPTTFALTGQTRILNDSYILRKMRIRKDANQASRFSNVGIGGMIYSDRNGIVSRTGAQFTYAYHLNFNNNYQLSMGLSAAAFQFKMDDSGVPVVDNDDPVLLANKKQFWVPDATMGIFLTNNEYYVGAAMTDLFGSYIKLGNDPVLEDYRTARMYNVMAGFRYNLNNDFRIEPSVIMRTTKFDFQVDLNTRLYYQRVYWFGVSYRTNKTIVSMVGININSLYFGYAYDASLSSLRTYSSGSHEIMMGLRFGDNSTRRFRWLKKDEVEFEM